ncbi:ELWxxDGT repeat protein [Melittangium boletus]|uniref:ELWxxDGT repeat protein n=1 Tax=Melittangium boletus TaxID=83453 RepID=UPI003DA5AA61
MDGPGADDPASDPSADGSGNRDGTTQPGGDVPAPGTPSEPTEPTPPPAPDTSVTLGTAYQVKAIQPPGDYLPRLAPRPTSLVGLGSTLFFSIDSDGAIGGLWKSDGTEAGTVQVQTTPGGVWEVLPVGGRLFFNGADAASGRELWVTDGTAASTRLVKDVTPGATGSGLANFAALGDTLLFFRSVPGPGDEDPGHYELWRSDGTEAGTRLVVDLGADVSLTNFWRTVGSTLFFSLRDPVHGTELWKTDGTPGGRGSCGTSRRAPPTPGPRTSRWWAPPSSSSRRPPTRCGARTAPSPAPSPCSPGPPPRTARTCRRGRAATCSSPGRPPRRSC